MIYQTSIINYMKWLDEEEAKAHKKCSEHSKIGLREEALKFYGNATAFAKAKKRIKKLLQ